MSLLLTGKVQAEDTNLRVNRIAMELEATIMDHLTKSMSVIMPYGLPCIWWPF